MVNDSVIVITGANRGIGKELVRQLAEKPHSRIYLTARSADSGESAKKDIGAPASVHVHPLDVLSKDSIDQFVEHLKAEHGENSINVWINNAGAFFDQRDKLEDDIHINYFGTRNVIDAIVPLMKKGTPGEAGTGGRILNMASRGGTFADYEDGRVKDILTNPPDSETVDKIIQDFMEEAKSTDEPKWGGLKGPPIAFSFYKVSKAAQGTVTRLYNDRHQSQGDFDMKFPLYVSLGLALWQETIATDTEPIKVRLHYRQRPSGVVDKKITNMSSTQTTKNPLTPATKIQIQKPENLRIEAKNRIMVVYLKLGPKTRMFKMIN